MPAPRRNTRTHVVHEGRIKTLPIGGRTPRTHTHTHTRALTYTPAEQGCPHAPSVLGAARSTPLFLHWVRLSYEGAVARLTQDCWQPLASASMADWPSPHKKGRAQSMDACRDACTCTGQSRGAGQQQSAGQMRSCQAEHQGVHTVRGKELRWLHTALLLPC